MKYILSLLFLLMSATCFAQVKKNKPKSKQEKQPVKVVRPPAKPKQVASFTIDTVKADIPYCTECDLSKQYYGVQNLKISRYYEFEVLLTFNEHTKIAIFSPVNLRDSRESKPCKCDPDKRKRILVVFGKKGIKYINENAVLGNSDYQTDPFIPQQIYKTSNGFIINFNWGTCYKYNHTFEFVLDKENNFKLKEVNHSCFSCHDTEIYTDIKINMASKIDLEDFSVYNFNDDCIFKDNLIKEE